MQQKRCGFCKVIKPFSDIYPYNVKCLQEYCKVCDNKIKYEKLICECGKSYSKTHLQRHLKRKYIARKKYLIFFSK